MSLTHSVFNGDSQYPFANKFMIDCHELNCLSERFLPSIEPRLLTLMTNVTANPIQSFSRFNELVMSKIVLSEYQVEFIEQLANEDDPTEDVIFRLPKDYVFSHCIPSKFSHYNFRWEFITTNYQSRVIAEFIKSMELTFYSEWRLALRAMMDRVISIWTWLLNAGIRFKTNEFHHRLIAQPVVKMTNTAIITIATDKAIQPSQMIQ